MSLTMGPNDIEVAGIHAGPGYNLTDPDAAGDSTAVGPHAVEYSDYYDYEYEYDYNSTSFQISLVETVPLGIVYGMTLVLGVLGNTLVIFAITKEQRMQTVTNTFLVSLASADLLLVLLCVPIKFAKIMTFTWQFGEVLCKLVHYMQNVSVICSVMTLTSMSMERYYAILHPMRAKFSCTVSRARRVILVVWVCSFVLATPILVGQQLYRVGRENITPTAYHCTKIWSKALYGQLYEVAMFLLIFVSPLGIMSFAYANICKELWVVTSVRASMRTGGGFVRDHRVNGAGGQSPAAEDDKTRIQVIKMLVLVVILFAICWGPTLIDNIVISFGVAETYFYPELKHMRHVFACMAYANSCVNPVVYAFMSKNFRQSFKHALCTCIKGRKYARRRNRRQTSFTTRTSTVSLSRGVSMKYYEVEKDGDTGSQLSKVTFNTKLLAGDSGDDRGSDSETAV